jgi:hypothetical protein
MVKLAYHEGNVEVVVHLPLRVVEELQVSGKIATEKRKAESTYLLLERVRSWVFGIVVVVVDYRSAGLHKGKA